MNLNQITIPSVDLKVSIPFYEKLGLKLIVEALPHYARFQSPKGNATFSLHQMNEFPANNGVSVYFECENLDDQVDLLIQQGVQFDRLPKDENWLWREARLRDPDGNQLILYFAGENRLNPPWRINPDE